MYILQTIFWNMYPKNTFFYHNLLHFLPNHIAKDNLFKTHLIETN